VSDIVQPLQFCIVLCIAQSVSSLGRHAQLTRCFSAVAELLVSVTLCIALSMWFYAVTGTVQYVCSWLLTLNSLGNEGDRRLSTV